MAGFDFDFFVIGAGSGGVRAARIAAGYGARVAIAEQQALGGTCVNVGCIPKKLFTYGAAYAEEMQIAAAYGWDTGKSVFDWQTLMANKNREILRLNGIYEKLLTNAGVTLLTDRAELVDKNTVRVNDRCYTATNILIATGGQPVRPGINGDELGITSNEAFYLSELPDNIVIAGGGYIAVEFASIFNGLGVDTTLLYRGPLILRGFDTETRRFLSGELDKKGVRQILNTTITSVKRTDNRLSLDIDPGETLDTSLLLFATGRKPNTDKLGLAQAGVETDSASAILVDDNYRTSAPSVYAIGDVTNRYNLTPVATAQGMALARQLYGDGNCKIQFDLIPTCVFSHPNLASVGLTEEEALSQYEQVSIYTTDFTHLKLTLADIHERTFMKLVVDKTSDRIIGAHMVGHDAGEIIQGIAIAMTAGATKSHFDATLGIHPTAAEEFVTMRTAAR